MRYLVLVTLLVLSACDSSENNTSSTDENEQGANPATDSAAGQLYSDANISFTYPDTWLATLNDQTQEVVLTTQEANELGTVDGCTINYFQRPNETLVELTLAYADNTLLPEPEPTFTYLTVNNQEVSRVQGFMQVGFAAAPVLTQIMYENETAAVFFCATVDLDDDIKLMFDSAVLQ